MRTTDGRSILEGKSGELGTLLVTGVHVGDRLEVPGGSFTIPTGGCTLVAR